MAHQFTVFQMAWRSLIPAVLAGAVFGGLWLMGWPAANGAKGVIAGVVMLSVWLFALR